MQDNSYLPPRSSSCRHDRHIRKQTGLTWFGQDAVAESYNASSEGAVASRARVSARPVGEEGATTARQMTLDDALLCFKVLLGCVFDAMDIRNMVLVE